MVALERVEGRDDGARGQRREQVPQGAGEAPEPRRLEAGAVHSEQIGARERLDGQRAQRDVRERLAVVAGL